jgi:flagellar motor protein MotB
MANDIVNTYSDALFNLYNKLNVPSKKGSQNGWPYCETETLLRIFQEAAEPHISRTTPSATSSSTPPPPPPPPLPAPRLQSGLVGSQTVWQVCIGALVVICCVLALAWQASRPAPANTQRQHNDNEIAQTWRTAVQDLVQSLFAEVRVLNSNQAALATSQAQIGADLAKLGNMDTQLAASASTQASATRGLAAAQTALAQETTNLVGSLRQTFERELAEATSQSRADTAKLQTQVAEVAASHKALLDRFSRPSIVPNLALALPGVRTKTLGKTILLTFDDGLFLHGTYFKPDAKSRLQAVAKALAQLSTPLRIEVIGCADDEPAFKMNYPDNDLALRRTARFEESLALDRASAVVNYFKELGFFAPKRLAALSSRGTNRPFPSDTVQNRAKNRTAVLRVSIEERPWEGYAEPAR